MMLGIYERLAPRSVDGVEHAHALIEATKRAFAHRDRVCVDFEIATEDFERLLSPASSMARPRRSTCAAPRPGRCRPTKATRSGWARSTPDGIAVSYIQSLYWEYGSGCVLPRTGVLMQNRGIAFSLDPAARVR